MLFTHWKEKSHIKFVLISFNCFSETAMRLNTQKLNTQKDLGNLTSVSYEVSEKCLKMCTELPI